MRSPRLVTLAGITILAVAACASGEQPGWTFAPPPSPTPVVSPAESAGASPAASAGPSASASASGAPVGTVIELSAQNVAFDKDTILAPAGLEFQIKFTNNDAGVLHNVEIKDANGTSVYKGEIFAGVDSRVYTIPALGAGSYQFICSVHPNMVGTLSAG